MYNTYAPTLFRKAIMTENAVEHETAADVDPDARHKLAKELVSEAFNFHFIDAEDAHKTTADNFYVVWFVKVLGNWKAMVSTDVVNGLYWEVTHNGAKKETYVDTYNKVYNHVVREIDA